MDLGSTAKGKLSRVAKESRAKKDNIGDGSTQTENSTDEVGAYDAMKLLGVASSNEKTITDNYRKTRELQSFVHDETPASIRIITEKDKKDLIPSYTKFILESVQEAHSERQQVVETFGDFYVFMYGERPPIYNFGGTLINSRKANWLADFMLMYERYLRGTRCTEHKARVLLTYGGRQVEGYIINTSNQTAASTQEGVSFSFQMIVTSRKLLGVSSELSSDVGNITDRALATVIKELAAPGAAGSADPDTSLAKQASKRSLNGAKNAAGAA